MSRQKPVVAIVGLGLVGTSVGLCLRQAGAASQVVGHDKSSEASSRAKKVGAVDRTEWNLIAACEKADIILLSMPFSAVRETLGAISPYVRPGGVVLDTSALKAPVIGWADEALPAEAHFVGLGPVLSLPGLPSGQEGPVEPRADLFQGCLLSVVPSSRAASDAVQLAADLVTILGAKPLFMDAHEHDGLTAAAEHLAPVLALALLGAAAGSPAWKEVRKLAGHSFESGTRALPAEASAAEEWLANRENLVRWIDVLSESLASIRSALAEGDVPALAALLEHAGKERVEWLRRKAAGDWDEVPRQEMPRRNLMQPLLGGLWPRRPKTDSKGKDGG